MSEHEQQRPRGVWDRHIDSGLSWCDRIIMAKTPEEFAEAYIRLRRIVARPPPTVPKSLLLFDPQPSEPIPPDAGERREPERSEDWNHVITLDRRAKFFVTTHGGPGGVPGMTDRAAFFDAVVNAISAEPVPYYFMPDDVREDAEYAIRLRDKHLPAPRADAGGDRKPASSGPPRQTTDERLAATINRDPDLALANTAWDWAKTLDCSASAVKQTPTWRYRIMPAKRAAAADRKRQSDGVVVDNVDSIPDAAE